MGTRSYEIIRFRRRYYILCHNYDGYFDGFGTWIVASIPADVEQYQLWLKSMRAKYAAKERALEERVYTCFGSPDSEPEYDEFEDLVQLPSEIPWLLDHCTAYFYVIDLDREVFTINHSVHWKLNSIPRHDKLWVRAIVDSVYLGKPTVSLGICPQEHLISLALELPTPDEKVGYPTRTVSPKTNIGSPQGMFTTRILSEVLLVYKNAIIRFGREWAPSSFPFRELAFALVSIASGRGRLHSFPAGSSMGRCESCSSSSCLPRSKGWLDGQWVPGADPMLEFGSMSHRPGDEPGVSPPETIYWAEENVLVSLVLVPDGKAITDAVSWAIRKGRFEFQLVVMSLFEVRFADVSIAESTASPLIRLSPPVAISPLRADYCVSTHPREREELPDSPYGTTTAAPARLRRGERVMLSNCTGTVGRLQRNFPGLAALVRFFEAAESRRCGLGAAALRRLPAELCDRILDFADYESWRNCLVASRDLRWACMARYRLDERSRVMAAPSGQIRILPQPELLLYGDGRRSSRREPFSPYEEGDRNWLQEGCFLSFRVEDMQTGEMSVVSEVRRAQLPVHNWVPVIGAQRKAVMADVMVQFGRVDGAPVEADTDEDD